MKRFGLYAILIAMITFAACSDDDFESTLTTDLETEKLVFSAEGGAQTFMLESNDKWFVSDLPDWLSVEVKDFVEATTRASYTEGKKQVTVVAKANPDYEERTTHLTLSTLNGKMVKLTVTQEQKQKFITDLESEEISFPSDGGTQSFLIESSEEWTLSKLPSWLTVTVMEVEEKEKRSTSYESGRKEITITAEANTENEARTAELTLSTPNGKTIKLKVAQNGKPKLVGYWILSEGNPGRGDAELAWYDTSTKKLETKQFKERNSKELGDTGNALGIYGSKMYVVIHGEGYGTETTEDNSYIEVINPIDGVSIKRIPFKDAKGTPAKPRSIIFEGGYGYISSYSKEVVRLDTATLTLDKHATLSGTYAEGLAYNDGYIYVCNSGQMEDNKISVVDVKTMKETNEITTEMNPYSIVSVGSGVLYFSTNYPSYTLFKLTTDDTKITEMPGLSVSDMTYSNNNIYTSSFSWDSYEGEVYQFNTTTEKATKLNLDLEGVGIDFLMEYHIGAINGSDNVYLTGMGEDVVIFDPNTQDIKHAFKTGTGYVNSVVAVYK